MQPRFQVGDRVFYYFSFEGESQPDLPAVCPPRFAGTVTRVFEISRNGYDPAFFCALNMDDGLVVDEVFEEELVPLADYEPWG